MKYIFVLLFAFPLNVFAQTCAETVGHSDFIGLDPKLAALSAKESQKINVVLYLTESALDWIFTQDVGDLSNYPQYADEIADSRKHGMEMLQIIADGLYGGDLKRAEEHVMSSGADLVQQYEFDRNHLLPYLNASEISRLEPGRVDRRGPRSWAVYDVPLCDAVKLAEFIESRQRENWIERVELYAYGTKVTDYTMTCSVPEN